MKRKDFIKGLSGITLASVAACKGSQTCPESPMQNSDSRNGTLELSDSGVLDSSDAGVMDSDNRIESMPETCEASPQEIKGPFPHRTPTEVIRENIIGDRTGLPLEIRLRVLDEEKCEPVEGLIIDLWHCDAGGNYSEYAGQLDGNFTGQQFLRGRGTTDASGWVRFISIYPGWYPGRAPHLHIEVSTPEGESLLVTQTALPDDISEKVYMLDNYQGVHDTKMCDDRFFTDLSLNQPSSLIGDVTGGYQLIEELVIRRM